MSYNSQQKLKDNIAAIRIALEYNQRQKLSDEQVQSLRQYSGFGGLKAILFPNASKEEWVKLNASKSDLALYPGVIELHNLLQQHLTEKEYKETIDSLRSSILTAFYTPDIIPKVLFAELKKQGIEPSSLYEPSSGAGVFITEAVATFSSLQNITAVEKDMLTGRVLTALSSSIPIPVSVQVKGFENTSNDENGKSDLIVSNIPFGNFKVLDEKYPDENISGKIHNYFFAKGLDKIKEGGLLAYITTDAFLNSQSNKEAREYLFHTSNFISLSVSPDNLMKDTGNTEASSHLLIVQKQSGKKDITIHEQNLIETSEQENEFGQYHVNQYIVLHPEIIVANEVKPGRNQYGRATEAIWQKGNINGIESKLSATINDGLRKRFNQKSFEQEIEVQIRPVGKQLTYLPVPENIPDNNSVQLGLFDIAPAVNINRAMAYITPLDATAIDKKTARLLNVIKTKNNPEHEGIVLLTAKSFAFKQYAYKLYSNFGEIQLGANWMNAAAFQNELKALPNVLNQYGHEFYNEGESVFHLSLGKDEDDIIKDVNPYHKEATLIVHNNRVGFVSFFTSENDKPVFLPSIYDKKDLAFYQQYTLVRDRYLFLSDKELTEKVEFPELRKELNESYDALIRGYGLLNSNTNKQRILKDEAFGLTMLASLERKEGEQFVQADVLTKSLVQKQEAFHTSNPLEALAKSLNDKGKVDMEFIAAATDCTEEEAIATLGNHICFSPLNKEWETADQLLSGNVVSKWRVAAEAADKNPENVQLLRSLQALEKVQPEKIPFELLDFNLGERWIPLDYYNRFALHLFELNAEVSYFVSVDTFKVKVSSSNAKIDQEYAVQPKDGRRMFGDKLLEHALENTTPFFSYEVDLGDKIIRVPDNDAIQLGHQKVESIRNSFVEWLKELPEIDKTELVNLYNDTFNCYVLREYDGSHLVCV